MVRTGESDAVARSSGSRSGSGDAVETPPSATLDGSRERISRSTLKCGEPHDRLQGATNLQTVARSKPSEPGGTARAERVRCLAGPSRRAGLPQRRSTLEWTRDGDVGGGADFGKPQERSPVGTGVAAQPALGPSGLAGSESATKGSSGRTVPVASPKERQRSGRSRPGAFCTRDMSSWDGTP